MSAPNTPEKNDTTVSSGSASRLSLGRLATRGAVVSGGAQIGRFVLQSLGIVLLGRILTPADYGILAMIIAIVGIGEIIRDLGLSSAAVQSKELSQDQQSVLFWINTAIGFVLFVALFISAPLIAAFYNHPEISDVVRLISCTFVINGVASQYRAGLVRDMKFGRISGIEVVAQSVALGLAVVMALSGWSYWSLAWQQIIQAGVILVGLIFVARWRPSFPSRGTKIATQLRYGTNFALTQLVIYTSTNISSVLLGKRFGAEPLGLYNRAYQLFSLPMNQLTAPATNVALSTLSKIQDETDRFNQFVLRGQLVLSSLIICGYVWAFTQADSLVSLVLGDKWSGMTPLLQIFIIGGVFQILSFSSYWIFLSKGLTGSNLRFALMTRSGLIVLVVLGSLNGIHEAAVAYAIGVAIIWPLGLTWLRVLHGVSVWPLFLTGVRTVTAYAMGGLGAYVGSTVFETDLVSLLMSPLFMAVSLLAVAAAWPAFRRDVSMIFKTTTLIGRSK